MPGTVNGIIRLSISPLLALFPLILTKHGRWGTYTESFWCPPLNTTLCRWFSIRTNCKFNYLVFFSFQDTVLHWNADVHPWSRLPWRSTYTHWTTAQRFAYYRLSDPGIVVLILIFFNLKCTRLLGHSARCSGELFNSLEGVDVWNPAFDVTPAELITGLFHSQNTAGIKPRSWFVNSEMLRKTRVKKSPFEGGKIKFWFTCTNFGASATSSWEKP